MIGVTVSRRSAGARITGEALGVMRSPPAEEDGSSARRESFRAGAAVEARWDGGAWPYPGVVTRVLTERGGGDVSYDIQYDDGESESGVPAALVMAPGDVRARDVEWRRVGTWVEVDGAQGTIVALPATSGAERRYLEAPPGAAPREIAPPRTRAR